MAAQSKLFQRLIWLVDTIYSAGHISREEITNIFGAADNNYQGYMDFITNAKKLESICKLGNTIVGIRDLPYFELIQSDERFINLN